MIVESLTLLEQRQPFLNVPQFEMKKKMVKRRMEEKKIKSKK
jgi:hypothetical protein